MSKPFIKVFLISMSFQFLISSLLYLGIKPAQVFGFLKIPVKTNQLISPQLTKDPKWEELKIKLAVNSSYQIKENNSLVQTALAAEEADQARAYTVVNLASGEILAGKNLHQSLPIASLTKIMTAMVALDLASPDEQITVTPQGVSPEPSKIMLKVGESLSLEELLHSLLLSSANDSAEVIKEGIDNLYKEAVFVEAMNYKAQELGLQDTHFTNPQGFDQPDHYSSAYDLAKLASYALINYPLIAKIAVLESADFRKVPGDNRFFLNNWNGLLTAYPGVVGLKTGNTDNALHTNIVVSKRAGQELVAVILGAPTITKRDLWTAQLLDLGFESLGIKPASLTEEDLKVRYKKWRYFND
jgi:serine-type D-Ala-D-Ala carboxypeptidase (penicillin-binding protein 5/6)